MLVRFPHHHKEIAFQSANSLHNIPVSVLPCQHVAVEFDSFASAAPGAAEFEAGLARVASVVNVFAEELHVAFELLVPVCAAPEQIDSDQNEFDAIGERFSAIFGNPGPRHFADNSRTDRRTRFWLS